MYLQMNLNDIACVEATYLNEKKQGKTSVPMKEWYERTIYNTGLLNF